MREDASERRAVADAPQTPEARFVRAFDAAPIGMGLVDRAGRFTHANGALAELLAADPAQVAGRPVAAFLAEGERERFRADLDRLESQGGAPIRAERTFACPARSAAFGALTVIAAIPGADRRLDGALLHVVDLSRRRAAEQAFHTSEAGFRNAFEHSPIGMVMTRTVMSAAEVNPALCEMLGMTRDEFLATPLRDLLHPDDIAAARANFRRVRDGEQPPYRAERRLRHRNGRYLDTVLHVAAIADAAGEVVGVLTQVIDRTEQRRAAAELERRQARLESLIRSKDEFVGSVSHELRTPLTSVVGFSTELRDHYDAFTAEERRQFVGLIAEQALDMANIVDDLLVAARTDISDVAIQPVRVDLEAEVDAVLEAWPALGRTW